MNLLRFAVALWLITVGADGVPAAETQWHSEPATAADGAIVFRVVIREDDEGDPEQTGRAAASQLLQALGKVPLKAVLVAECFEDLPAKQALLRGVCQRIPADRVYGQATYGAFAQEGCTGFDSVCLVGIGGDGIAVSTALVRQMGITGLTQENDERELQTRLRTAGATLAGRLRRTEQTRLIVLGADAHSPSNQLLVEGVQQVVGKRFPLTGGSANKNEGQTYVYFRGKPYPDSAIAVALDGQFSVTMTGRKGMDHQQVVRTAKEAATDLLAQSQAKPLVILAYNCAGRRGKLRRPEDELQAIQQAIGTQVPLFGCYCAGEVGPVDGAEDADEVLSGGSGWHVMFTAIRR